MAGAILSGGLFAWLYYKTGSLVPGILIHILNNSLSVFLSLHYPDVKYTSDLLGEPAYWCCLAVAAVLFAVSCKVMNSYRLPATDTTLKYERRLNILCVIVVLVLSYSVLRPATILS